MNKLYDALENGISALEQGETVEAILSKYADVEDELRPILEAALQAGEMKADGPSLDAVRRGRLRLLQRAAQMREGGYKSPRRIPAFQRLASAFILAALFLASGTGLVQASAGALPGENLYPVKRTWEDLRLFLAFDQTRRQVLTGEFENERLEEVSELLAEGRHEQISFAGVLMEVNGQIYVAGIRVVITPATQMPDAMLENGAAVIVTGRTNADGFVEAISIELLPPGSVVPAGQPIEIEAEDEENGSSGSDSEDESGPSSEEDAGETEEGPSSGDDTDETEEADQTDSDEDDSSGSDPSEEDGQNQDDGDVETDDEDGNGQDNGGDDGDDGGGDDD